MSFPSNVLKKVYRFIRHISGSTGNFLFWKYRHWIEPDWASSYLSQESIYHPHRNLVVGAMSYFPNANSVFEAGCASGPNLIRLKIAFPRLNFYGIDVSAKAVDVGNRYAKLNNLDIKMEHRDLRQLDTSSKFDVALSDASLIYVSDTDVRAVLGRLVDISTQGIILVEHNTNAAKSFFQDTWIHNYEELLKEIDPKLKVYKKPIPQTVWTGNWVKYGCVITAVK